MSEDQLPDGDHLVELIRLFRDAQFTLQSVLHDQIDAVLDPVTGIPILLESAQNYLRLSEARYYRVLTLASVIVFELQPDGTTHYVNESVFNVLGYTVQEVQGKNWWNLFFPDGPPADLYHQIQKGDVKQYEVTLITKTGAAVVLELTTANRYRANGTLERILGLGVDITARRKAEQELHALEDAEEQRTLEKNRVHLLKAFIQNASHEFRTPLSIINSSAYLLARYDDPEKRKLKAKEIERQVERIAGLLDKLLKMAVLEDKLPKQSPVNLVTLLHSLCAEVHNTSEGVNVICDIPYDLPPVTGYREYLRDAIHQILENARHYTPQGGKIKMRAFAGEHDCVIEIQDTGPGISPQMLLHIFETFSRQDIAHTTPGLGLGLAMTHKIIKLHGGHIEVESKIGQGSLFRVFLPR